MTPGIASSYFAAARRAASAIEPLTRELAALEYARSTYAKWTPGGGGGARQVHSDPTASAAQSRIEGLVPAIQDARARLDALTSTVGDALAVIDGVRRAVGERHALVLETYYIDCAQTWSEVASELGLSRETVRALRDAALAYVDSVGISAARMGVPR